MRRGWTILLAATPATPRLWLGQARTATFTAHKVAWRRLDFAGGTSQRAAIYALSVTIAEPSMPAGVVRFFNAERGFGFISRDDGREDIFVHITALERSGLGSVNPRDFLEFDVELDPRTNKFIATNLDLITPAPP